MCPGDHMQMGQTLARLQIAETPPMGTTYGLYSSRAKKKYDELLPLLVLLFIMDLKNVVCSTDSQKTEVPADNIQSIMYCPEARPAGLKPPLKVVLCKKRDYPWRQGRLRAEEHTGLGRTGVSRGWCSATRKHCCCPSLSQADGTRREG